METNKTVIHSHSYWGTINHFIINNYFIILIINDWSTSQLVFLSQSAARLNVLLPWWKNQKHLGVIFDTSLTFNSHHKTLVQNCFDQLKHVQTEIVCVSGRTRDDSPAFISTRLDYCNSCLICLNQTSLSRPVCAESCSKVINSDQLKCLCQSCLASLLTLCVFEESVEHFGPYLQKPCPQIQFGHLELLCPSRTLWSSSQMLMEVGTTYLFQNPQRLSVSGGGLKALERCSTVPSLFRLHWIF